MLIYHTGLPTKDKTLNTIPRLDYDLCLVYNLFMAYSRMRQKKYKFSVAGNHKYKETEIINSVQLSLTSHPLMGKTVDWFKICPVIPPNFSIFEIKYDKESKL